MGRILALSSQVARGHVGLSAIVPALQRLGHEVIAVPTIILSNHPGHPRAAGTRIEVNTLASMMEVLEANGWLAGLDAVITGYMPTTEHVSVTARMIDLVRLQSPDALVLVDPVMGDDPRGLYIEHASADAFRADLVPRANLITPNRFELSWLTGIDVRSRADAIAATVRLHGGVEVLATSVPAGPERIANVLIKPGQTMSCAVTRYPKVPHGTGDLLTGLYVGHLLNGVEADQALGRAVGQLEAAIELSLGQSDLKLAGGAWLMAHAVAVQKAVS